MTISHFNSGFPLNLHPVPTSDSDSYKTLKVSEVGIPLAPHVGAFGVKRKHHIHEGIDLYADEGEPVWAINEGVVTSIYIFTGPVVGMPWWRETWAMAVQDETGSWVYGEIEPDPDIHVGDLVRANELLGTVKRVLVKDKGRPTSMLHLERWKLGCIPYTRNWLGGQPQPEFLEDPTPYLLENL